MYPPLWKGIRNENVIWKGVLKIVVEKIGSKCSFKKMHREMDDVLFYGKILRMEFLSFENGGKWLPLGVFFLWFSNDFHKIEITHYFNLFDLSNDSYRNL